MDLGYPWTVDVVMSPTDREDCCHAQIDGAVVLTGYLSAQGGKTNIRSACMDWIGDGLE